MSTNAKTKIIAAFLSDCTPNEVEGRTIDFSLSTNEIIDELVDMVLFTQDEVNSYMSDNGYSCDRHTGEVRWTIYRYKDTE